MANKCCFPSFNIHIIMEKLEQSLQIKRRHHVQHTISVRESLTIRNGIEKKSFFLLASVIHRWSFDS